MKRCGCANSKVSCLKQTQNLLFALSEDHRLKILCFLNHQERSVGAVWRGLKIPQNLVSHHLQILKKSGLIYSKKIGKSVFYGVNKKTVKKYIAALEKIIDP